jgi:hypothetical protein
MKLITLSEGDLTKALAHATGLKDKNKSLADLSPLDVKPENGQDFGSRVAGNTSQPSGVPIKPRHRRFLGMPTRQFSLQGPGL